MNDTMNVHYASLSEVTSENLGTEDNTGGNLDDWVAMTC